jgi:adenylate cyclase class 2
VDPKRKHLVELKARYEDLGKARALLAGGEHVGTYRQVDTYFALGEKRLKVRSVEGQREGQLIYYERPDEGGPKESRVTLAPLPDARAILEILRRVFPVQAEVRKTREIHRYRGVQVHLDTVQGLGRFVEFEKVLGDEGGREEGRRELEDLRRYLQIPDEDLMASSYSNLVEPSGP